MQSKVLTERNLPLAKNENALQLPHLPGVPKKVYIFGRP